MKTPMQQLSVRLSELVALVDGTSDRWFSKDGTIIRFSSEVSGFILPAGGTAGVINCRLYGDRDFNTIPIPESDILQPLPSIREVDLTGTTCDPTTIFFAD